MIMPTNQYVEVRNGGYYVAGTRIGLDVLVYEFRRGGVADDMFRSYPSIGSLAKVYGAITFILEHPAEIEAYLADQDRVYEEIIRTSWIGLQPGTHSGYPAGAATNGAVSRILISGCLSLRANFRVRGPQIGTQLYPTIPATCRKETLRAILRQAAIDADDFLR